MIIFTSYFEFYHESINNVSHTTGCPGLIAYPAAGLRASSQAKPTAW